MESYGFDGRRIIKNGRRIIKKGSKTMNMVID
jgi:hypothetical protein